MNCLAVEQDGWVMLVDCGVTFDGRGLGVDVVHPDFTALEPFRGRIAGVFITHGHEDHIGALPYLLRSHDVPVWTPRYSLGLLRARSDEHEVLAHANLIEVHPREKVTVGPFEVEPTRVTHSTPDATALAIQTAAGTVIHTGDFKFDDTPPDGEHFDVERLAELGARGVALLCSDSTNIDTQARTGSEKGVGEALERLVNEAEGRVVIGLFASNVHRLRLLGGIAKRTGRRLVALGRSVRTHAQVAAETGYLGWPLEDLAPLETAAALPRERVLGVATGTQAEGRAALARIARRDHPFVLDPGDTVIFSSRVIPGHETEVFALTNDLMRRGIRVITRLDEPGAHVSGHAARPEQERMIELTRPRAFLPLHGTLHHLTRHAALAESLGVATTCVLEDGEVAELSQSSFAKAGRLPSGRVHVAFGRPVAPEVIRERIHLAARGFVVAVVRLDGQGLVQGAVDVVSRGVLDDGARSDVAAEVEREARNAVLGLTTAERSSDERIGDAVRVAVRRAIARATGYKPEVEVSVARVAAVGSVV
jgi:ribonuclease J